MHQLVMASKDTVQAKCGEVFALGKGDYLCHLPVTGWQSKVDCDDCLTAETVPPDPTKEAKKRGIETTAAKARQAEKAARAKERAEAVEREAQQSAAELEQALERSADDDSPLAVLLDSDGDGGAPDHDVASDGDRRAGPPTDRQGDGPAPGGDAPDPAPESAAVGAGVDGPTVANASGRPDGQSWDPDNRCPDGGVAPCPEPDPDRPQWGPDGWDNPDRWAWWWGEDPGHPARAAGENRLADWWAGRGSAEGPAEGDAGPVDERPAAPEPPPADESPVVDDKRGSAAPDAERPAPGQPGLVGADTEPVHEPGEAGPDPDGAEPRQDEGTPAVEGAPAEAVRPRREHELTEPIVFPHVPVVITASGTVLVLEHQEDIPGVFAFDSDQWCVDATIEIRPNRRK